MKKLITMALLAVLLTSCGSSKRIDDKLYECYGFFDKSEIKDEKIHYEFVSMNLVPGIIFSETILVPLVLFGLQSHCPIEKKEGKK